MEDSLNFLQMEDDLIFFYKWKTTSIFLENGRQLPSLGNVGQLQPLENGRHPQYLSKWKMTSLL